MPHLANHGLILLLLGALRGRPLLGLEQSEPELGLAKQRLEEKEGKKYVIEICERCNCEK